MNETDLINLANGTLKNSLKLILDCIEKNANITQKELAVETNLSLRTIKRNITVLKENYYIERIGSKKSGYWKILKNIDLN